MFPFLEVVHYGSLSEAAGGTSKRSRNKEREEQEEDDEENDKNVQRSTEYIPLDAAALADRGNAEVLEEFERRKKARKDGKTIYICFHHKHNCQEKTKNSSEKTVNLLFKCAKAGSLDLAVKRSSIKFAISPTSTLNLTWRL
jgi:hypothetical protein